MKAIKWLDEYLEEFILIILSSVMVSVIFAQVFMRFVLGSSLPWSEELARYCFIWIIYVGISYGVKKQRHIKVDIVLVLLKERGQMILTLISNLLFLVFAIFVIIYGTNVAQNLLMFGQKSAALNIPMGLVFFSTPIGLGLTAIRIVQQIIQQIMSLLGKGEFQLKSELDQILEEEKKINQA